MSIWFVYIREMKINHAEILDRVRGPKGDGTRVQMLVKGLGITSQAIYQWDRVPPERAKDIERILGIPAEELCPQVFK